MPFQNQAFLSQERISALLARLSTAGKPQRAVANLLQIPNQYLTDYKCGRRRLNAEIAQKMEVLFGAEFKITARWLLGEGSESFAVPVPVSVPAAAESHPREERAASPAAIHLPVFFHPIEGDPNQHAKGSGFLVEIVGPAKAKMQLARLPYVLKFGATDRENRLQTGDWLLMSQSPPLENADLHSVIQVIRHGRGMYLARRLKNGWQRLAKEFPMIPVEDCTVHGHAMAIIWGELTS